MSTDAASVSSHRNLRRAVFAEEEARNEKVVNIGRMGLAGLALFLTVVLRGQVQPEAFVMQLAAGGAVLLYGATFYLLIRSGKYGRVLSYISTTLDVLVVSALLWGIGGFRTFKSPAFLVYFVLVALAAYRYAVSLTVVAGALCLGAFAALAGLGIWLDTVELGTLTEHFTTPAVSPADLAIRMAFLLFFIVLEVGVAVSFHRLIRRTALTEIRAKREAARKQRMRDTFSRYLTQQVAEVVLDRGVKLEGERRTATVLFCDIRDFTRISERMEPEEVVELLNEVLSAMVDAVFEHGGTLDKFVGDSVMAVFGAPLSTGSDEERAVRAAVDIRTRIDEINERRTREGATPIRIGIGVHTGEVVAGNIGSPRRMEYTVIGRTVNVASRLEQLNKELSTDILVSEDTFSRVEGLVEAERQEPHTVRGVSAPVTTYRVIGLKQEHGV